MYNFPTGAILGYLAGIGWLIAGGTSLWRSGKGSVRLPRVLMSIVLTAIGMILVGVSTHLVMTRIAFDETPIGFGTVALPTTSPAAIGASVLVLASVLCLTVGAIIRRQGLALVALITGGFAAFSVFADTVFMNTFSDGWALANAVGWLLTIPSLIALVGLTGFTQMRAYGVRQFERGKLEGLSTVAMTPADTQV